MALPRSPIVCLPFKPVKSGRLMMGDQFR